MSNFFSMRTIEWQDGEVRLIDQTKLPEKLSYVRYSDYERIGDCIKNMVVRGAPAIGIAAAMGLGLAALKSKAKSKSELLNHLKKAASKLESTRPTAVNLFWATSRILKVAEEVGEDAESTVEAVINEAKKMADENFETNLKIGKNGAELLEDNDVVLTHCKWLE